jgi:hypothetical protein
MPQEKEFGVKRDGPIRASAGKLQGLKYNKPTTSLRHKIARTVNKKSTTIREDARRPKPNTMKSRSIPIASKDRRENENSLTELEREDILADYKDYCFYTRLVAGMSRKQQMTRDVSLRYQNQALIDHIIDTRRDDSPSRNQRKRNTPYFCNGNAVVQDVPVLIEVESDDLIFDMEI